MAFFLSSYLATSVTTLLYHNSVEKEPSPLIGVHNGTAIYLLYNGVLKDKGLKGGNILTRKILSMLPKHDGDKIIFGAACRIDEDFLKENKISFRQIPKDLDLN